MSAKGFWGRLKDVADKAWDDTAGLRQQGAELAGKGLEAARDFGDVAAKKAGETLDVARGAAADGAERLAKALKKDEPGAGDKPKAP